MNKYLLIGAAGILGAAIAYPAMSKKNQKKLKKSGRNAFYKVSDIYGDMMD